MCEDSGAILTAMPESTKQIFLLKENIKTFVNPGVKFWRHHCNVLGSSHLVREKVHPNHSDMKGFHRSVISALLQV